MTMRKLTQAQEIQLLKNEVERIESFLTDAAKEAEELDKLSATRVLTKAERKRVAELCEYIHEKSIFVVSARKTIKEFYKPATVI